MTSNMVMILAGILERLRYSFPEENTEMKETAKVIKFLHPVRERLKQFIEKADANPDFANVLEMKRGTDIMRAAHNFEDSMELYMLGIKSRRNRLSNEINSRVNEKSLRDASRRLNKVCHLPMEYFVYAADKIRSVSDSIGQSYSYESDMVGMVGAEKELISVLMEGTEHLKLVSICGMPGIGKTTLALRIYEDPEIEVQFEVRAWVSVSQHMNRREILLKIHHGVDSDAESDDSLIPEDALAESIRKYLKGKNYLVVLDDVPDANAWFCLRNCFPDNEYYSRILITTQLKDAAILVDGPETHIHNMRHLTDEESSDLLSMELTEEEIEKFGKNIKDASGGLPLALVTLAYSVKDNPFKPWEWHLENLYGRNRENSLFNVLDLSYRRLPIQLRSCLLYLANYFPKLTEIEMDTVCQLLVAEGLVPVEDKNNGRTMMDVAALYLDELDNRCLIQILEEDEQNGGERRFKSCRIHNVIGGFCKSEENNGGFVEAIDLKDENRSLISSTRVGLFLNETECSYGFINEKAKIVRSLLIFNSTLCLPGYHCPREIPSPENFIRLRVLYLYAVDLKTRKLPDGIGKLVHLRYLSFRDCYLEDFCSSISNLYYLQTLDLRVRNEGQAVTIPCDALNGLGSLRYLYLPPSYQTTTPNGGKLNLETLKKLELLHNFDACICLVDNLLKMPNLMWVTVATTGYNEKEIKKILSFMEKNSALLRSMSLNLRDYDCYSDERWFMLERVFNSVSLHALNINGHIRKLPQLKIPMTTSALTRVVLNGTELDHDPMQILKDLPNLKILLLETEAYNGSKMKCLSGSFLELRCFKISKLYNLSEWEVDHPGAMPSLTTLIIQGCKKLGMLPKGLQFLTNLKKLEIMSMPDTFLWRIKKPDETQGEDFNLIKHVHPNIKVNGQTLIFNESSEGKESEDAKVVLKSQTVDPNSGNGDLEYLSFFLS